MLDFVANNDLLSAIIAFGLVLIPAILVHELGHFLAAKAVGITVLEFGIGFPPRALKLFSWGETEFTLNWIPLGGFVRPLGEDLIRPLNEAEVERDREKLQANYPDDDLSEREELSLRGVTNAKSVNEVKPWPRIFFMAAGAIANFVFAFLLFVVVGLLGLPEDVGGRVQIADIPSNSTLVASGIQAGDFVEAVNGELFTDVQDYFRLIGQYEGQSITLTIRQVETNSIIDVEYTPNVGQISSYVRVVSVEEGSPAHTAGIIPGDLIAGINDNPTTNQQDPVGSLQVASVEFAGSALSLTILRDVDGELMPTTITVVPREQVAEGQGRIGIGISTEFRDVTNVIYLAAPPQRQLVPQSFGSSITYAADSVGEAMRRILEVPSRIINQTITPEEARPVSIIAISQVGGQFLQQSITDEQPVIILNFMALISIALGFTNLLPIPALDGGRILFVLIEIVRGRPMSPEREGLVHLLGLAFMLSLGVLIMLYDIFNPFVLPQ